MLKKQTSKKVVPVIYQAKSGALELRGDMTHETVWATQTQIAEAFEVNVPTINEHIKNIYKNEELRESSTIRKFRIVQLEGKRLIEREVQHYNLDMIISVGYIVLAKRLKCIAEVKYYATNNSRLYLVFLCVSLV